MFFTQLDQLESILFGYQSALRVHSIDERSPCIGHFREWLEYETGWSVSCGWAFAIRDHVPAEYRTARFFEFIRRFEALRPVVVAGVDLADHHRSADPNTERPDRLEVVQYQPEPLHFIRFSFPARTEWGRLSRRPPSCSLETSLDDAKRWAREACGVDDGAWDQR